MRLIVWLPEWLIQEKKTRKKYSLQNKLLLKTFEIMEVYEVHMAYKIIHYIPLAFNMEVCQQKIFITGCKMFYWGRILRLLFYIDTIYCISAKTSG
jgi:hypothetical protein